MPGTPKIAIVRTVNILIEISQLLSLLNIFRKNKTPIVKEILNITLVLLAITSLKFNCLPIYIIKSSEQRIVINQVNRSPFH